MDQVEYLVDPALVDGVTWEPHGSGHRFVLLPDSDKPADNPPNKPSPTANNLPDVATVDVPADPTVPAVLTIVTQFVLGQSWLYPDGRWTGPTKSVQRFTDIKLLCTSGAPTRPQFTNDHATAI